MSIRNWPLFSATQRATVFQKMKTTKSVPRRTNLTIMQNEKNTNETKFMPGQAAQAATLVDYQPGSIVSREILKKTTGKVTLFAFDADEGLSEHTSPFDALVQVLEGEVEITIAGKAHHVVEGQLILMPATQPHALKALKRFNMILTMIRS